MLKKELGGVCKACYAPGSGEGGAGQPPRGLREAFVRDLTPEGPSFPQTLGELTEQLKSWRSRLQVRQRGEGFVAGARPACAALGVLPRLA